MSDDRCSVTESNKEKFEEENCLVNDRFAEIAVEVPEGYHPRELCCSLERNSLRIFKKVPVSSQHFSRFTREILDYLIDGTKREFPRRKNCGNSRVSRTKDDNPNGERDEESTYSGEPIHHERNVARDRKGDKFIPSEVAEDTGTRSPSAVEYCNDEQNCDRENDDDDDNGNDNQRVTSSSAMDKSPMSHKDDLQQVVDEASTPSIDKGQEDHGLVSCDAPKLQVPTDFHGSPELGRKFSRTNAARDDSKRLKSATLDRMGKLFKLRSTHASSKESHQESAAPKDSYEDPQSRQEKTNSLGRMFKLVDKNGEPRKIFPQSRTGSLSHILRRKSTGAEDENSTGKGNSRGVFSKLLNQWKNRSGGGNATAEPNLCTNAAEVDKSLSAKPPSTSRINVSSTCADPPPVPSLSSSISPLANTADVEYPA